jgi:alanine-synthesizing transaminase
VSRGIPRLRRAICHWYQRRYGVEFDPETEAISTIGSKEGIAHLALATLGRGDTVLVPNPSYPIHIYGPVIAGGDIRHVPITPDIDFFVELENAIHTLFPKPKMLIINFPSNPTAQCVELPFFEKIVALAREHGIWVVHDLAYAGHHVRRMEGAVDHAGSGRARGCRRVLHDVEELQHGRLAHRLHGRQQGPRGGAGANQGLSRLRHVHPDPGGGHRGARRSAGLRLRDRDEIPEAARRAREGAARSRMDGRPSQGVDVRVGEDPEPFRAGGSLEFTKALLAKAKVSVSPGIGFGEYGDEHVRFAMIENENRTRQAVRGIKQMFREAGMGR